MAKLPIPTSTPRKRWAIKILTSVQEFFTFVKLTIVFKIQNKCTIRIQIDNWHSQTWNNLFLLYFVRICADTQSTRRMHYSHLWFVQITLVRYVGYAAHSTKKSCWKVVPRFCLWWTFLLKLTIYWSYYFKVRQTRPHSQLVVRQTCWIFSFVHPVKGLKKVILDDMVRERSGKGPNLII